MKRLNKYITDAGYCSRREADAYIEQGRVTINGRDASLGDLVGEMDTVEVDGERVGHRKKRAVYIACHKPVGITCTSERSDKTNIVDFLGYKERIFPVGRLDKDSEGLILLTNDGDIVNKILRAGNNNPKEYIVTVDRPITPEFLEQMAAGVRILGVKTKPCRIVRKKETTFVIYLTQGLNRQIRRMCQALGYKVVKLKRTKVLNIALGDLSPGEWRHLSPEEARQMHLLLADASGTEEASNEKKAARATPSTPRNAPGNSPARPAAEGEEPERVYVTRGPKKSGSYADYRRGAKGRKSSSGSASPAGSRGSARRGSSGPAKKSPKK